MPEVRHQTIRLSQGRHGSPAEGACVLELASMLAGGPFGDHSAVVCPAIAAFLRGYNDQIDEGRRQDLIPVAAEIVNTRADERVTSARGETVLDFARRAQRATRRLPFSRNRFTFSQECHNWEVAGGLSARAARRDPAWHEHSLQLVTALALIGPTAPTRPDDARTKLPLHPLLPTALASSLEVGAS